ncbi:hypothetical protein EI94DRAFT_1754671 [Lactarius quietus]|nr:hypothetical protein EI94DRAFT_1754671 [Lactarius quietus]
MSRSIAPDGGVLRLCPPVCRLGHPSVLERALALGPGDATLLWIYKVLFFSLLATLMAVAIEKSAEYASAMFERTQPPLHGPQDEAMDVDPTPSHSAPTVTIGAMAEPTQSLQDAQYGAMNADPAQLHSPPPGIPLPGNLVDGKREVVWIDLTDIHRREPNFMKTGNVATPKERLQDFSKNPPEWDVVLLPGTRKRHCGPQDGGVPNVDKRRELLFIGTADSIVSRSQLCLLTERSKDTRTAAEKAELLAWADRCCALNEYERTHPDNTSDDEPALAMGTPTTTSLQVSECAAINERLQQMQAEIARLTMALTSAGLVPPCPTVVDGPETAATAHREPGAVDAAATVTATVNATMTEIATTNVTTAGAAASPATPSEVTTLGNGRMICFEKQSVPDPPRISFAKDIPQLAKMWDDSSVDWDPAQAVLHIQGEPIALKHWKFVYRYGKAGQWAGAKKLWYQWQDIATSWQELTEEGFWQKYSSPDGMHMAYSTICKMMKQERIAADRIDAERAKEEYGDRFCAVFEYRRGGERHVMNKPATIAKHYRSLHSSAGQV